METTDYCNEEVKLKHPEVREEWGERVVANPFRTELQEDGRIRYWGFIVEEGRSLPVVSRVINLEDAEAAFEAMERGETLRNPLP